MDSTMFADYIFISEMNLWRRPDAPAFAYSDGDAVENSLKEALLGVQDRSLMSPEIFALQKDWPTTYHLSARRANLLRPFENKLRGARVLELGCGCGAVTRYLGECGAQVCAVDGSPRRAGIAVIRCGDLSNVQFIADTIQNLSESLGSFDVVTLIGVLEYAHVFDEAADAPVALLRKARSFLKKDGVLIVALENKLGLKYFAGVPEDHIGLSWGGIANAYQERGVKTYSAKELRQLLTEAGFVQFDQFIPVPDYKLPISVIFPAGLQSDNEGFDVAAILSNCGRAYEAPPVFNLPEGWRSTVAAGLSAELANSLVFVAQVDSLPAVYDTDCFAVHYGDIPKMQQQYAKSVVIRKSLDGLGVQRRHLYPTCATNDQKIKQILDDEPYFAGRLLLDTIRQVVVRPGWTLEALQASFAPWIRMLTDVILEDGISVPAAIIDLTPFNIIVGADGQCHAFDQEWRCAGCEGVLFKLVLLRGIVISLARLGAVSQPANDMAIDFLTLTQGIAAGNGIHLEPEECASLWDVHNVLDNYLCEVRAPWSEVATYTLVKMARHPVDAELEHVARHRHLERQYTLLEKNHNQLAKEFFELQQEVVTRKDHEKQLAESLQYTELQLAEMENSRSWRVTKPLRVVGGWLRRLRESA